VAIVASPYIGIIAGTGGIMKVDIWATIDEQLHEHTVELGLGLQDMVRELTPILTGALIMDIAYEAYTDGPDLAYIYAEDIAQEAFWNRVYAQYQEGGPLGEHTYTNDPHEMFYETAVGAGNDYAQAWAALYVNEALALCVAGAGVPL
jgi:hypothetical protein